MRQGGDEQVTGVFEVMLARAVRTVDGDPLERAALPSLAEAMAEFQFADPIGQAMAMAYDYAYGSGSGSPMSSHQSCGLAAMKSRINATQSASSNTTICTPCSASHA